MGNDMIPPLTMIGKWLVLIGAYVFVSLNAPLVPSYVLPAIIVFIMIVAYATFRFDKRREENPFDNFSGTGLFFRYGRRLIKSNMNIPVSPEWDETKIANFANDLLQKISAKIKFSFEPIMNSNKTGNEEIEIDAPVWITDREYEDRKDFLRVRFWSKRRSYVTHFIHNAVLGKTIVTHYYTYVRGKYAWYDVADFIILAPITIWKWFMSWRANNYSILSSISRNVNNSYDAIDLTTFYQGSYALIFNEIEAILKENGLLTEGLERIIGGITLNINNSSIGSLSNFGNTFRNAFGGNSS